LTFDIIGAYLVISGLLKTDSPLMAKLSYLKNDIKELREQSLKMVQLYHEKMAKQGRNAPDFVIDQLAEELEEAHEKTKEIKLNVLEITVGTIHNFLAEIMYEKQYDKLRVRSGLPFLIGGFTLQGIGVINQLL